MWIYSAQLPSCILRGMALHGGRSCRAKGAGQGAVEIPIRPCGRVGAQGRELSARSAFEERQSRVAGAGRRRVIALARGTSICSTQSHMTRQPKEATLC